MISRTLLSLLFLLPAALHAQSFSTMTRVNDGPAGSMQGSPFVVVDRTGMIHVAWTDYRNNPNGDLYLSRSTDGGRTFSANAPIHTGGKPETGLQRGVQFVIAPNGTMHFIWQERQEGDIDVYYSRSTDGGATFSTPKPISGDQGRDSQDFPSIAVDSAGTVYVAFVDDREMRTGFNAQTQIYMVRSTNDGLTFSPAIRASNMPGANGGSCECCNTSIAASPDGHVYISFRSDIDNLRDIWIARSFDRGETFVTAVRAASERWKLNACPTTGSSIVLDREETAHVAWRDSRPSAEGKDYIYYTTLRYGDTACAPDMRISDSPRRSNFPSLTVTPEGGVFCAFQDNRNDEADIYAVYSYDGGNSFTRGYMIGADTTGTRQELIHVAYGPDGTRYAVWQDGRRDDGDILFSRDDSPLTLVLPDPATPITPVPGSTLADFQQFSWSAPPNLGSAGHVVYDLTYEHNGTETTIRNIAEQYHRTSLEPGTYRWWVLPRTAVGPATDNDTASFILTGASDVDDATISDRVRLEHIPNPIGSDGRTVIRLSVPVELVGTLAHIVLYDALGRPVRVLLDAPASGGERTMAFDLSDLPSGYYRYRLTVGPVSTSRPMTICR